MESKLQKYIDDIEEIDTSLLPDLQKRMDSLTKPTGSLGRLEELALHICLIVGRPDPPVKNREVFVMAGDSGVVEEGVSAYPQEVTPQMIYNFLNGGAAINAIAATTGFNINVVDVGVKSDIDTDHPSFYNRKVRKGTRNFSKERAMTTEEAMQSVIVGIEMVLERNEKKGLDILATGDMGIGNTTPSSAITSVITGSPVKNVTGYGTGIDANGFVTKVRVIEDSIELHKPDPTNALDVLSSVGSYEIGAIAGIILGAAIIKRPVLVDGFISQAAALIACTLKPEATDYIIPSHQSSERGSNAIWRHIGLRPYLYFDMRLGEGTGALLMGNLIETSINVLNNMATFDDAGVSDKI